MAQWWHIDTHRSYPVRETRYLRRYRKEGFRSAPPPVAKHWHKTKTGKYRLLNVGSKASKRFIPGPIGWAFLAHDVYRFVKSRQLDTEVTESTPKPPYDLSPWIEAPKFQYQELVGYEDDGSVHWSRTV